MKASKVRAVVFDLDGTLIDSKGDILGAFRYAFEKLGAPAPPDEELIHTIGARLEECFIPFLGREESLLKEAARQFRVYYERNYLKSTRPFPGMDATLRDLGGRYLLGLATMKKGVYARNIVGHFGWDALFGCVTGAEEGLKAKPDPEMLLKTIEKLGCGREETVYVGDTEVDLLMSAAAGVRFVFVEWGYGVLDGRAGSVLSVATPGRLLEAVSGEI